MAPLAGLVPICIALAWIPLRSHLPNTDVALVLVVAIAGTGFFAGRIAVLVGSLGAGSSFDLFHTRPYGHIAITHGRDVLTTAFLVLAGLAMGELACRLARYRRMAASDADALALVTDAAGLVATGSESRLIIEALTEELVRGLGLADCRFEHGPPRGESPQITRSGGLVGLDAPGTAPSPLVLDLPIWASGDIVAHFELVLCPGQTRPSPAQCRLAVSIADQVGAAFLSGPPEPPQVPSGRGKLRLVRG